MVIYISELGDLILENDFIVTTKPENIHKYSLEDVVLPLPGSKIQYPNNFTRDFYTEILAEDDLDFASFENLPLEGTEVWFRNMEDVETASEGQIRRIRVSFNLASSCYATMCLRELTKSTML